MTAVPAGAAQPYTVRPGDSLWSISAAHNFTTRALAAYNGLPENGNVVLGSTIRVPTVGEGAEALRQSGGAPASAPTAAGSAPAQAAAAPQTSSGGYLVRRGDTLSALAATSGAKLEDLVALNGLDPKGVLVAGTKIRLPGASARTAPSAAPASQAAQPASAPAKPTAAPAAPAALPASRRVGAADVQQVARQYGVPASLATAIAWQESGFNNAAVSSAQAQGVMQVIPRTWRWVQSNLAQRPLNPSSAGDNIQAGVLYLKHLLEHTGGDEQAAIASYYQGPRSVRNRGMYDDTKRYVANVQALRSRFGG